MSVEDFTTESQFCIFDNISWESFERSIKMIARFTLNVLKGAQNGLMTDNFKLHIVYILVFFYVKSAALEEKCWLFWCSESVSAPLSDLLVC